MIDFCPELWENMRHYESELIMRFSQIFSVLNGLLLTSNVASLSLNPSMESIFLISANKIRINESTLAIGNLFIAGGLLKEYKNHSAIKELAYKCI